jgi:hypothetical protein
MIAKSSANRQTSIIALMGADSYALPPAHQPSAGLAPH